MSIGTLLKLCFPIECNNCASQVPQQASLLDSKLGK